MNEMLRYKPTPRNHFIELTHEEKAQLNTIIDLFIPADKDFPPPSSLHLIDEFFVYLMPSVENNTPRMLSITRLRTVLEELNISAGGSFCKASVEKQQALLRQLERRDPAFFQALWTLANHSYYTRLARCCPLPHTTYS